MSYSKYVNCLDCEYELSRPKSRQIIEIGLTVVDAEKRQIVQSYSFPITYSNPRRVAEYLEVLKADLSPAMRIAAMGGLQSELDEDWVSDDIEKLTGWNKKKLNKQGEPLYKVIDRLETKYGAKNRLCVIDCEDEFDAFGEDNPFGRKTFNISEMYRLKTRKFESVSLLDMIHGCGLEFVGRQHSGKDDSYNLARVFLELTK